MRYIKDIANPEFKIGLYQWNNKYIIKVESGMYEQTYKLDAYEVENSDEVEVCMDPQFLTAVRENFERMQSAFFDSLKRNNVVF